MNIIILGAGAIGSLFGALLCKKNNVTLIGRPAHVKAIRKNGLIVENETKLKVKIQAVDSIDKISNSPDLQILTVKSFDTVDAMHQAMHIIDNHTVILSLQNGLDNVEKIEKIVDKKQIIAGITNQGAFFSRSGLVKHTGKGKTIIGELYKGKTDRIKHIADLFNEVGIETSVSENITKEIWFKGVINSCINPLTTIFQCKNGYLLKNPILEKIVENICKESTNIARIHGINITYNQTIQKTKEVIKNTSENYSSMLQSFKKGKKTEIDSINGKLVTMGKIHSVDISLNKILIYLVKNMQGP